MKLVIVGVFALAVCWGVSRFVNLGGTAFSLAQVPISWTMLLFIGACVVVAKRVR